MAGGGEVATSEPRAKRKSLVDTHLERTTAQPARRVKRKGQDTEEEVAKALRDNFRTFTALEVDGVHVDGLTLRARLTRDKLAWKAGDDKSVKMGKNYYLQLRDAYAMDSQPSKALRVDAKDVELTIDPVLLRAMVALKGKQCNRAPLIGYLGTCALPNAKDCWAQK